MEHFFITLKSKDRLLFNKKFVENCNVPLQFMYNVHCKDTIPKIRNKCSQKKNCAATFPISTFIFCERFTYSPNRSAYTLLRKIGGLNVEIYRSLTGTRMWKLGLGGRAIPFLGIHKSKILCSMR